MNAPTYDSGSLALMLNELRLPTIGRLWPEFAQRADTEGWPATRLLGRWGRSTRDLADDHRMNQCTVLGHQFNQRFVAIAEVIYPH